VLKFTYSNLEIQFFLGEDPFSPDPHFPGRGMERGELEAGMGKGKGKEGVE